MIWSSAFDFYGVHGGDGGGDLDARDTLLTEKLVRGKVSPLQRQRKRGADPNLCAKVKHVEECS